MSKEILQTLFTRDLERLKNEISLYESDAVLWETDLRLPNSGGNLCLHLIGNLRHFIGANIGKTGYIRNRDAEFSDTDIPREKILAEIDATIQIVTQSLPNLTDEILAQDFPEKLQGNIYSNGTMLFGMLNHLNYHLGQINYHRRFFTK